jgi:hypothetical protein
VLDAVAEAIKAEAGIVGKVGEDLWRLPAAVALLQGVGEVPVVEGLDIADRLAS